MFAPFGRVSVANRDALHGMKRFEVLLTGGIATDWRRSGLHLTRIRCRARSGDVSCSTHGVFDYGSSIRTGRRAVNSSRCRLLTTPPPWLSARRGDGA